MPSPPPCIVISLALRQTRSTRIRRPLLIAYT
jgi:hypothetical protein